MTDQPLDVLLAKCKELEEDYRILKSQPTKRIPAMGCAMQMADFLPGLAKIVRFARFLPLDELNRETLNGFAADLLGELEPKEKPDEG